MSVSSAYVYQRPLVEFVEPALASKQGPTQALRTTAVAASEQKENEDIMSKYLGILVLALTTACAGSQKAPGTEPGDMSSSEHAAEADKHEAAAESHQSTADSASKPAAEGMHEQEAAEEGDIAEQHDAAADAAK